jgi:hypothetical protein
MKARVQRFGRVRTDADLELVERGWSQGESSA